MPTLTPVDNDPFAPPSGASSPKLTPVDHDPFATSSAPPAGQDLGTTALWNKPANTSWSDFMLAHLSKPFQGADQAAQDYSRTAVDAATFGQGDRLQAYLTGNPLAQERASTAAASGRLGAMAPIVQGAMYAMGPGEIGAASKIGEAAAPWLGGGKVAQWTGGVLGSAAEGAGAGAAGAVGHDESIGQGALIGGALGAAGGVPGGIVGRGGTLAPAVSEDALRADASEKYTPLEEAVFHGPSQIKPALDAIKNTMTEDEQLRASGTMTKVNKLIGSGLLTGKDIQANQKALGALSKGAVDTDREYAPQFKRALEGVMQGDPYGRNLTPGQGMSLMPPGQLGGTGFATGAAAAARDAGNIPFGMAQDTERVFGTNPQRPSWQMIADAGGSDVGTQAKNWLPSQEGLKIAPQGSPLFQATKNLAATAKPDTASPSWYAKHSLIFPLAFGGATIAANQVFGEQQSPVARAAEDAMAFPLMLGGMKGYSALAGARNRAAQQAALDALRTTASTGKYQPPVYPPSPLLDAVRQAIYGRGAAGGY